MSYNTYLVTAKKNKLIEVEKNRQMEKRSLENSISIIKKEIETTKQNILDLHKPFYCKSHGDSRFSAPKYYDINTRLENIKEEKDKAFDSVTSEKSILITKIALTFFLVVFSFRALSEAEDIIESFLPIPFLSNFKNYFIEYETLIIKFDYILFELILVYLATKGISYLYYRVPFLRTAKIRIISGALFFFCILMLPFIELL